MHASQQAALDYKHINDRFQRGKTAINKLMDEKHHLMTVNNLVQQRGTSATVSILNELCEGVTSGEAQELLVVDLLPSRFAEWGMAAWEKQRESLAEPTKRIDVRFLSVYHSDSKDKAAHEEAIRGKIMKEWWDSCELAGPKSR
ncbi:Uncharacterized protein SCF082_LOCUS51278, partial [Durusdinium trenchii]